MPEGSLTVVELHDRTVDLVRQLVVYADGRTASLTTREAQLLAYLAARPDDDVSREELLDQVWSYRASYATRAVDVAMRRLRAKVEPDPQRPTYLISVHGVGYRFVSRPAESDPPRAAGSPPSVPERATFVGRRRELAQLSDLVSTVRLVTVLGPGGVGKTRLVEQLLTVDLASQAARASVWCDLTSVDSLNGFVAATATALGVVLHASEPNLVGTLGRALAARGPLVVVFDAVERVGVPALPAISAWLEAAPDAVFVVTSRERLRLVGEQVIELEPLVGADAEALLLDRMAQAGVDVEALAPAAVTALVERLEGLPLAIELAAPRARTLPLEALGAQVRGRVEGLGSEADNRTLRAVLDASWDLLDDDEQRTLAWCSAFVGGFTLEAAESVLDVGGDTWPLDRIEALRDKSLLRVFEGVDGGQRLGLYASVRAYAATRLAERGEGARVEARHAAYYVAYGEELALGVDRHGGRRRMRALAAETDNLLAVVRRRLDVDPVEAARAALALEPVFIGYGPAALYGRVLDEVLAKLTGRPQVDPGVAVRLDVARANMYRLSGDVPAGLRAIDRALAVVDAPPAAQVRASNLLGLLKFEASALDEALAATTRARTLARDHGLRTLEGTAIGMLAAFTAVKGGLAEAEGLYATAITIDLEVGNEPRAALDSANLGLMLIELDRLDEAERHMVAALDLHVAWKNTRGAAGAHGALSTLRARLGDLDQAYRHAAESERLYREAGYARFAAMSASNCALLRWAMSGSAAALPALRDAVARFEQVGDRTVASAAHAYLAGALADAGDRAGADAELERALAGCDGVPDPRYAALTAVARGFLALSRFRAGDPGGWAEAEQARDAGLADSTFGVRFFAGMLRFAMGRR